MKISVLETNMLTNNDIDLSSIDSIGNIEYHLCIRQG